jgi:hypothetical protein
MEIAKILETEYNFEFDELRKNRMCMSYYKYGPVKVNYDRRLINALESMKKCIMKYELTGNTEYLVDAANYGMIEFTFPQHANAFFCPTRSDESAGIVGMSIKEIEDFKGND